MHPFAAGRADADVLPQPYRVNNPFRPLDGTGKAGRGKRRVGAVASDKSPWRVATAEVNVVIRISASPTLKHRAKSDLMRLGSP